MEGILLLSNICYSSVSLLGYLIYFCSGLLLGEFSGGNWMILRGTCWYIYSGVPWGSRQLAWIGPCLLPHNYSNLPLWRVFWRPYLERLRYPVQDSYLVDSASSHMLVSKIKPCMSKYKQSIRWNCEWLIKSVIVYLIVPYYLDNRGNSRANTC